MKINFRDKSLWLILAAYLLLASLFTFSFKKPTFFWQATNLNDLFLAASFFCLIVAFIKKHIISSIDKRTIRWFGVGIGAIIIGTLISRIVFHTFSSTALREYARIIACIIILAETYLIGLYDETFTRKALLALALSSILLPFIFYAPSSLLPFFLDESQSRFTGFLYDPNYFATLQILPAFILLWISYARPFGKIVSAVSFIVFVFSIGSIIWSGSRGGIVGLIVGIIVLVLFILWKLPFKKAAVPLACLLCGCILGFYSIPKSGHGNILYRFQDVTESATPEVSGSNFIARQDRQYIWANALQEISKNPFGYGPGYESVVNIQSVSGTHRVAHSTLLQIFLTGGFILFLTISVGAWCMGRKLFSTQFPFGEIHFLFSALIGIIVAGLFLDSLWSRWVWVIIGLILVIMHRSSQKIPGRI